MISVRHGSRENSSYGGNGMCRKNPIVTSLRCSRSIAGNQLELVVVDPHDRVAAGDVRAIVTAKRSLTAT